MARQVGILQQLDETLFDLRRLFQGLSYRHRLLRGVRRGVELSTIRLLRAVQRSEAEPSIGDVADLLNISASTASRQVERALAGEFLESCVDIRDRRRIVLTLTPTGLQLLEEMNQRRRDLLFDATSDWAEDDLIELTRLTELLTRDLTKHTESQ